MSIVPLPVFRDISPVVIPEDIQLVLEKLGREKVIELFANMGIALRGNKYDIFSQCAFVTSWDYKKTKLLRDMYALSEESGIRLTGFLIQASPNYAITDFQSRIRNEVTSRRAQCPNSDDLDGIIDARPEKNNLLACLYRYKRKNIKSSDLRLFQDVPVDIKFLVYDTGLRTKSNRHLYCVAIRPNISFDYKKIRGEFTKLLNNTNHYVSVFALKKPSEIEEEGFSWMGFEDCSSSNQFMTGLLDKPVLENVEIQNVSLMEMFKWNRVVETTQLTNIVDSQSIEEDLDHHLKDMTFEGASLQKAKTIITTFEKDKHACSTMNIMFKSTDSNTYYDTELKFKVRDDGLELKLKKITRNGEKDIIYDMDQYWDVLWDYWNKLLIRYVQAVDL